MIPLIEQIEQTIIKREQELKELRQQLADAIEDSRPLHHKVALKLFQIHVNYGSPRDVAAWESEINNNVHNWSGEEHQFWLVKANRLIEQCEQINQDPLTAITMFNLINEL